MRLAYKILRSILVSGIVACIAIYIILYLLLSLPSVQREIKDIGEEELGKLLKTNVSIGSISISPFNQVVLDDVVVPDQKGDTIMTVERLGAGVSLYNLILNGRIVFTYAEIIGLDGRISKPNPESPLNIQFIIDALSSKDKNKPPAKFDLKFYNVVMRRCAVKYDVLSEPRQNGKFDKNHISIHNMKADISLPRLKNNDFDIYIKRLALKEECGFEIKNITTETVISSTKIEVNNLQIELPHSVIAPEKFQLEFSDLKNIGKEIDDIPLNLNIANSYITPSDFSGFVPALSNFSDKINITLALRGYINKLNIPVLSVNTDNERLSLNINGTIYNLHENKLPEARIPHIDIKADAAEIAKMTSYFSNLSDKAKEIISNCGNIRFNGSVKGTSENAQFNGDLTTSIGEITLNASVKQYNDSRSFSGMVSTGGFNIGKLLSKQELLNETAFDINLTAAQKHHVLTGKVEGNIKHIDVKGYRYSDISANIDFNGKDYSGAVSISDENINLAINGVSSFRGKDSRTDIVVKASDINLAKLNLYEKYPLHDLSFGIDASFTGDRIDNSTGHLSLNNIEFKDNSNNGIGINHITIDADNSSELQQITLNSDLINGNIKGEYDFKCLVPAVKSILSHVFPSFFPVENNDHKHNKNQRINNFNFNFKIAENNTLTEFFNLPFRVVFPITLSGSVNESENKINFDFIAPYIQQKNKIIENTSLHLNIDVPADIFDLNATSLIPNKKGNISVTFNANAANDRLDTGFKWWVAREHAFNGEVNLSALFERNSETNGIDTKININPSELVFNDTVWNVNPAIIDISKNVITVNNFDINCDKQYIRINGTASKEESDEMCVDLQDINLDYVFETLGINNVTFGGRATGKFYASNLFSKIPRLSTPNLHVEGFSYNNAVFGTADIKSTWNNETKGISLNADILQSNGLTSLVRGYIFPTRDSLNIDFYAKKLDVKFLRPFVSAFTTDIQGKASGHARLFGTFKDLNLTGDIFADELKMKIDYLNTYYTVSDSIKIRPGIISFRDVEVHDKFGHTASLSGNVKHSYFRDAYFDFSITNAHDFLCYDVTQQINPDWFGTIFGNGSAFITGEPGLVNIDVNMATAQNSRFTFILSDTQAAGDYNFITFTDRNKPKQEDTPNDTIPEIIKKLKYKQDIQNSTPSRLNLNLQVEATPLAQMILIMDPVSGDKIKATGSGNLRINYNSADDEMKMFGTYTIAKGNYNFTLQDIIIREFIIKEGSSIAFHGDPLAATLNIGAIYSLNANLKDLDESFATDKEMNRTNVPVHALLMVKGDIKQPAISFDLEFPTLQQDAYRKIKSIISTEDMMNRQIIYLLALNRFYTPEYMGVSNNNRNELASVASSTISSQLSNILGQISDNWSISPNFRTNKGDFSDVEVELALSSQLLNNRLLFNGNFGYRDKNLNNANSNFIGDFDIEYLLNKNGNVRLKAYNHFNDQNYYIKSALTTQGVGVVFKYDFDRPFDFLRKPKRLKLNPAPVDTFYVPPTEIKEKTDTIIKQ